MDVMEQILNVKAMCALAPDLAIFVLALLISELGIMIERRSFPRKY